MPGLFQWRRPTRVVYVTPPAERSPEAELAEIDLKLSAIACVRADRRSPQLWWELDRLLDRRNNIQARAGYVERTAAEYWRNP